MFLEGTTLSYAPHACLSISFCPNSFGIDILHEVSVVDRESVGARRAFPSELQFSVVEFLQPKGAREEEIAL